MMNNNMMKASSLAAMTAMLNADDLQAQIDENYDLLVEFGVPEGIELVEVFTDHIAEGVFEILHDDGMGLPFDAVYAATWLAVTNLLNQPVD